MLVEGPIWLVLKDKHSSERIRLLAISHHLHNVFMIHLAISITGIEVIGSILYMKRVTAFCPSRELFLLPGIGTTGDASPLERTTLVGPWEAEYDSRSYVVLGQKGLSIQVLL